MPDELPIEQPLTPDEVAMITRIAKVVMRRRGWGWTLSDQEVFIDGAPGLIFTRLGDGPFRYERRNGFAGWCFTVLDHMAIDEGEKRDRLRQRTRSIDPDGDALQTEVGAHDSSPLDALVLAETFHAPFSESDKEKIRQWRPRPRIILLCLAGLWAKVPDAEWKMWLAEARAVGEIPPPEWRSMTVKQFYRAVASAINVTPANWDQIKHRWLERLFELDVVRKALE